MHSRGCERVVSNILLLISQTMCIDNFEIITDVAARFLLPRLAMDLICDKTSVASLRSSISTLPTTYERAYELTFARILKQPETVVNL